MKPLTFIIVGSGWRAMFYARIAKRFPEQFQLKYMLCRQQQKAERIAREYGIPATTSIADCEAAKPDFVVVAVTKTSIFDVTKEWALRGYAVLCETPAAMTVEQLKELWNLKVSCKARIQVAEQYLRYPVLAAGLEVLRSGKLGEPYAVSLSVAHDYHGASLIRHMLNPVCAGVPQVAPAPPSLPHPAALSPYAAQAASPKTCLPRSAALDPYAQHAASAPLSLSRPAALSPYAQHAAPAPPSLPRPFTQSAVMEPVRMWGKRYVFPVTETDSRYGAVTDGSVKDRERTCITMEFASGKTAFYDFAGVQYHSFIRSRHLNVQGRDGEWNDTVIRYVNERHLPEEERIRPYLNPRYQALETEELTELSRNWSCVLKLEELQDEYAIATLMFDMREYLDSGKEIYPLEEALEDAYLWILMQQAVQNPWSIVESEEMPWQK